ncbi:MAG: hypothetical protein HKM95_10680 [Inquilinus sp.]|nr:hypothetical protein [Inquilinus sp.]
MARHRPHLHSQLVAAAAKTEQGIVDTRVGRVLALLGDTTLVAKAAEQTSPNGPLAIESPDAAVVWDDPQVQERIAALAADGITVERREVEIDRGGMIFRKWVLTVAF